MAKKPPLLDGLRADEPDARHLFFTSGSSDKEYKVSLRAADDGSGWLVDFQYGKRGSALKTGSKTAAPLAWQQAAEIHSKVVLGQLRDGYTECESGAAYQSQPIGDRFSGLAPMLPNPMEAEPFEAILADDDWMIQEKFDGERLTLIKTQAVVKGVNRKGLFVAIPKSIEQAVLSLPANDCVLDGEWLGQRCALFDLLELDGEDLRGLGAEERMKRLDRLLDAEGGERETFVRVLTAFGTEEKQKLHDRVQASGGEGVVAKLRSASHAAGRPSSGGPQIKRKFVEEATLLVGAPHPSKRSVELFAFDENMAKIGVGRVSVPPNAEMPECGSLLEVRYLYAFEGGGLHQPVYKAPRTDLAVEDARISQLKFKPAAEAAPASAPKRKSRP